MSGEKKPDEIWHWTDGVYRLVNITPVRREVEREVVVDGKANLTPKRLHEIAMMGVRARRAQTTPEQRRAHASHAGKIGNAKRYANHVKKEKRPPLTKEQRAEVNRQNGRRGNEARWGASA